jgi:hypothetical protein
VSSVWTKARKNTPEIDCGLCGFTTCGAFARAIVVGSTEIPTCPILSLDQYASEREELKSLLRGVKNNERPAPEQPEGGVLLSKPCVDSPDLLMAEMRIFNGVPPGEMMKYGVLDPGILCWFLDCVSSRYKDMRCSKELAYAWGDLEETKVHILRDGRVRMRRARGAEHALDSFRIIERTVMGAIICNCCGRDLLTVLTGLVDSTEEHHTVLRAGSTVSLNEKMVHWTPRKKAYDLKQVSQMIDLLGELYSELMNHLDLLISSRFEANHISNTRSKICQIISFLNDPEMQGNETIFLRGLSIAFFIDNAMLGLDSLYRLLQDGLVDETIITRLLEACRNLSLQKIDWISLSASEMLSLAHAARVERAVKLYSFWNE